MDLRKNITQINHKNELISKRLERQDEFSLDWLEMIKSGNH
jgi:hypothetical protein